MTLNAPCAPTGATQKPEGTAEHVSLSQHGAPAAHAASSGLQAPCTCGNQVPTFVVQQQTPAAFAGTSAYS